MRYIKSHLLKLSRADLKEILRRETSDFYVEGLNGYRGPTKRDIVNEIVQQAKWNDEFCRFCGESICVCDQLAKGGE